MIESIVAKAINPVTGRIDRQYAVLALHHAAIGDIHPVAVDVLDLHGRNPVRGIDDQIAARLLGLACRVGAISQSLFVDDRRTGDDRTVGIFVFDLDVRREVRDYHRLWIRNRRRLRIRKLGAAADAFGGIADHRIKRSGRFGEQDKRVPATHTTCTASTTCAARSGAGCSGLTDLGRVYTRLDGGLQLLNFGQLTLAGRGRRGIVGAGIRHSITTACQHLLVEGQRAVAPDRQFTATGQADGDRTGSTSNDLLTGKDPVTFSEGAASSIACYRKHLADNCSDDTNQSSHESILRAAVESDRNSNKSGSSADTGYSAGRDQP